MSVSKGEKNIQKAKEKIKNERVSFLQNDITNEIECQKIFDLLESKYGKLDGLINCAGTIKLGGLEQQTLTEWNNSISINLTAIFMLSKILLPLLKRGSESSIINISSIHSEKPGGSIAYCTSKAGADMLTKFMAQELTKYKIRVNSINPAFVESNIYLNSGDYSKAEYEELVKTRNKNYPLGRIGDAYKDIGALAEFAGNEIKRILHDEDIHTKGKGLNDVVTVADVKSEKIIADKISELFPNDTIIAEESGKQKEGTSGYSWAIDPLDGTMNYSKRMPYYCVSIGYLKDGKPEGGAVYIPEMGELYFTEKGKGAYLNDNQIHVANTEELSKSLTTIGFNNRYPEKREFFNNIHGDCMNKMLNVEKLFSTVISLCYVASGKVESHFELYCFLWDIAVGALLIEEAGGKMYHIK